MMSVDPYVEGATRGRCRRSLTRMGMPVIRYGGSCEIKDKDDVVR